MRFKEYFLLRESPDYARFMIDGNEHHIEFDEDGPGMKIASLIITDTGVISSPTKNHYHEQMFWQIKYLVKNSKQPLTTSFTVYGTIKDEDIMNIIERGIQGRDRLMNYTDSISLARLWYIPEADAYGISFWRTSRVPMSSKKTLARYFNMLGIPLDRVFVERLSRTETFEEFLNNKKIATKATKEKENKESEMIHLLPSDKKRQALLDAGARPKAPVPMQQRMQRDGD